MHDVSPELALVDRVLAEQERDRLPDPDDCLAPRPAATPAPLALPTTLTLLSPPPPPSPPAEKQSAEAVEPEVAAPAALELVVAPPEAAPATRVDPIGSDAEDEPSTESTAVQMPVEPELEPTPARVEDTGPPADDTASVAEVPAPAAPTRIPEWVASDVAPKSRRNRPKDRARARREPRPARRRVAVAASWVVLCGFLASPLLAFIPSPSGERPTLAPDGVESVPDAGDDVGHALRWDPVPKAAGYSVVFVNDGVRSDRWSERAGLRLPAGTESEQLVTYEWFVYPAFRDGAGYRYGPLVASGEVTMPKLAPTESS